MKLAGEQRKLLVVDDDPVVRKTLALCLREGYEVTAVESGERALQAFEEQSFPVVVLDLRMDGISGIETLKQLKAREEPPSVIILTAHGCMETAISAVNFGAFNYLTKPFDRSHLLRVVEQGYEAYARQHIREEETRERLAGIHDDFFSHLCHEFNTPLNAIIGFSELLISSARDSEQLSWAREIGASGDRLHEVLMEMVDYISVSHLAAAGVEEEFHPHKLIQPLKKTFAAKDVKITIHEAGSQYVRGPSKAIFTLVRQLIKMAARISPNLHLTVSTSESTSETAEVRVSVSTAGAPMEKVGAEGKIIFWKSHRPEAESILPPKLEMELGTLRKIAEYAKGIVECRRTAKGEANFVVRVPVSHPEPAR